MMEIKLGVVGGHRGAAFNAALEALKSKVRLVAVCDTDDVVLARWRQEYPHVATFGDHTRMLDAAICDAVFIATPLQLHARQAIAAMNAGLDVISEVTPAQTIDDCWALVETVEKSGRTYMLAENYCYIRENMAVLRMVQEGMFGEAYYAEGAYLHDCRDLTFDAQGHITWRGEMARDHTGNWYPTHSLGPVAQWLGAAQGGDDRLAATATFCAGRGSLERFINDNLPAGHPLREVTFRMPCSATTLITTEAGKVISLRLDWLSTRPHNTVHYALQGLKGAYCSPRQHGEDHLVWLEGISPALPNGMATSWEPLSRHLDRFEHPLWQEWQRTAEQTGHGGSDFFVLSEFVNAVAEQRPPAIDVYDAATWGSITPLSEASLSRNGTPVEIPRFRRS